MARSLRNILFLKTVSLIQAITLFAIAVSWKLMDSRLLKVAKGFLVFSRWSHRCSQCLLEVAAPRRQL